MKKVTLLLMLLSTFLLAEPLKTVYSYQNALHIAKKENKLVLFITTIRGCPVCNYLKDIILKKEDIENYLNEHYVVVIKDAELQQYPERFHTRDMPSFYFIDPNTEKEVRPPKRGGSTPDKFLSIIRIAVEGKNEETKYKPRPMDEEFKEVARKKALFQAQKEAEQKAKKADVQEVPKEREKQMEQFKQKILKRGTEQ